MQLPVFFFWFFCQACLGLWNRKLVFLILKISQYRGVRRWYQLFPMCSCKKWYKSWNMHFHKIYWYQILQTSTSRRVFLTETNQADADDISTTRSLDKLKQLYIVLIATKLGRVMTNIEWFLLIILLCPLVRWSCRTLYKKHYISTTTVSIATKLCRIVTNLNWFLPIILLYSLVTGSCKITW